MSAATTLSGLRYPIATDAPYVHLDMKNLAEDVDEKLFVASSAAPPHKAGRRWHDTDDGKEYVSDGTAWHELAQLQAATQSAFTLGSGWTHLGTSGTPVSGWQGAWAQRLGPLVIVTGALQKASAIAQGEALLTMNAGWRPLRNVQGAGGLPDASAVAFTMSAAGQLQVGRASAAGAVSFGITYVAEQ